VDPNRKSKLIGWYNRANDRVWLDLQSSYAVAQELARQQTEPFNVRLKTLGNRLKARGLLAAWGAHRNTVQRKIDGRPHWVLCLDRAKSLPSIALREEENEEVLWDEDSPPID